MVEHSSKILASEEKATICKYTEKPLHIQNPTGFQVNLGVLADTKTTTAANTHEEQKATMNELELTKCVGVDVSKGTQCETEAVV